MILKKLTLQGYKTFASRTSFEFDRSLTAIIGPNGSGKSNIADAIRWVLGEQSYSTLRGKKTVDMIFAGSRQRSRSGMAQAILTLDNSDGWLPIDYSEIEIGRRDYRSGENVYLLNGQQVRLREIAELLSTSGLAERTYTIIGQGLIDRALSLRADERRALFEEAAGITHYKSRRAETLRRLKETDQNLQRVHDILSEIKPRLSKLKRQANRAQTHKQVAADLHYHLRVWYGYQWERARLELRHSRNKSDELKQAWELGRNRQLTSQELMDGQRVQVDDLVQKVQEAEENRDLQRNLLEQARRDSAVLEERLTILTRQQTEYEEEVPHLTAMKDAAYIELDEAIQELNSAQTSLNDSRKMLEKFKMATGSQTQEIGNIQSLIVKLEERSNLDKSQASRLSGQLEQLQHQLENNKRTISNNDELEKANKDVTDLANRGRKLEVDESELEKHYQKNKDKLDVCRKRESRLQTEIKEAKEVTHSITSDLTQVKVQIDVVDRIHGKAAQPPDNISIMGVLKELLEIPQKFSRAIEAALSEQLDTWIVSNENGLWHIVEADPSGKTRVVVADDRRQVARHELPDKPGVIGWANDLIKSGSEIEDLAKKLFGNVLIVSDSKTAYDLAIDLPAGAVSVSLDGFVAHTSGLVEIGRSKEQSSLLARSELQRKSKEEIERLQKDLDVAKDVELDLESEVKATYEAKTQLEEKDKTLIQKQEILKRSLSELRRKTELSNQHLKYVTSERLSVEEEIVLLLERVAEIQDKIAFYKKRYSETLGELDTSREELSALPVLEAQEQEHRLLQQIDSTSTILAGRQAVVDSRRATLIQIDEQLRRRKNRIHELQLASKQLDLEKLLERVVGLQTERDALEAILHPLKHRLDDKRNRLSTLEKELTEAHRTSHGLETRYAQARMNLS
ncbi:MAG: AAA family ATPase, partial [Deltaproteobacteria bacterium]|nr:AAA family ATPase [Deltaproteobacteria bacterium]